MPPVSGAAGAASTRGKPDRIPPEGNPSDILSSAPAGRSIAASSTPGAAAYNLKIVSDASPDLSDLDSLIHSTTSRWPSIPEKVWALFYWTHILKRQTAPIVLHGFEVTDPIRNFTDYGFTMCSTISGINQSLYERLGVRHQYWDLCNHSVSAVEYGGRFRMVDSSMSNLVTTDDGVTLASVEEAAADGARLVRERSLYATSANGFLTGTDQMRNLADTVNPTDGTIISGFAANFCADGLKFRDYYYNWDAGHRYVLNLRENETYTRYYQRLGTIPDYWVGSERTQRAEPGQHVRNRAVGSLRHARKWQVVVVAVAVGRTRGPAPSTARPTSPRPTDGLRPAAADQPSEVVYKVQAANAVTSQNIHARFARTDGAATATISVSVNHGLTWIDVAGVGTSEGPDVQVIASLRGEVNGSYETLVRIQMRTHGPSLDGVLLKGLTIETLTQVNAKALPKLNVGRNEITVGTGDQSDTMVLWPDLRGDSGAGTSTSHTTSRRSPCRCRGSSPRSPIPQGCRRTRTSPTGWMPRRTSRASSTAGGSTTSVPVCTSISCIHSTGAPAGSTRTVSARSASPTTSSITRR